MSKITKILETVLRVNITEYLWREALEEHKVVADEFDGIPYYRFVKKVGILEKGSVIAGSDIIFNFPRIARILQLENGIKMTFAKPFYVEEKVDGYNVRIAKIEDTVLAFTRGSYVCPFSTDRLVNFFNIEKFFTENPNLIICGEIAGPGNPYNREFPSYVTDDVEFFAFDIRVKNTNREVRTEERYRLFDKYRIPTVTRYGKYASSKSDREKIKRNLKELNEKGCEGIVLKPTDSAEKTVKYVTLDSCHRDMKVTSSLMMETPAEFFTQRIVRAVFYLLEHEIPLDDGILKKTGESLMQPIFESVRKAIQEEMIGVEFEVKLNKKQNVKKLFDHFRKCKVDVIVNSQRKTGKYWHVKFQRRCFPTYEIIQKYWNGLSHFD
ncbi:MAG: RNA ligase [Candidatus Scalindua sp.]|nr:RNA ligase [Candidatus Scalindua sp.]